MFHKCLLKRSRSSQGEGQSYSKSKSYQGQTDSQVRKIYSMSILTGFIIHVLCNVYNQHYAILKKFVQGDGSIATNFTFATPPRVKFLNPRQISAGTCTPSQLMDTPRWSQVPSLQCAHPPHPSPPAVPPDETLHTLVLYSLMNSPSNVRKPEWRFPGGERGVCGSGPTRHPPNTGVSHPGRGTWPCMYIRPVSTPCKYMLYLCWAMLIAYLRCVLFDESSVIDMFTI